MSSDYDPNQFGLVKLDSDAGSASGEAGRAATPEDILFEEEAPSRLTSSAAPGSDDDGWEALPETPLELMSPASTTFPAPEAQAPEAAEPSLQPPPRSKSEPPPETAPRPRISPRPSRVSSYRLVPGPRPSGWMVPLIVFSLGAVVGGGMYFFFHNPPLAGLAVVMGMIGSLFTRILLRGSG